MNRKELEEQITAYMTANPAPLSADDLQGAIALSDKDQDLYEEVMKDLEENGVIVRTRFDTFGLPQAMGLVTGRCQVTSKGFGFVVPLVKNGDPDLFVPANSLSGAMDGDTVMARVSKSSFDGRLEGKVIRILKRAHHKLVGTFSKSKEFAFVIPDNKRISRDIYVRRRDFNGAKDKEKVVVEITTWPDERRNAEGKIVEILGKQGDIGLEILSIIKDNDLPTEFPAKVQEAAQQVEKKIKPKEIENRKDRRDWSIITIDGVDAKDLDDAVYVEKQGDNYFLGVYIADVSYYVHPHTALDNEAYERGTSVYLVDRVLPMLPVELSNGICSLNEGEDRLTMSCEMLLDGKTGKLLSYEIAPAVINSLHRMNYDDVRDILVEQDPELRKKYQDIVPMLETMAELSKVLKKRREKRGSINFELPEQKVILDEKKHPIEIKQRIRSIAEMMIEEFMLAANETVAAHMAKKKRPFIYRVHDVPDRDKITDLAKLMSVFGVTLKIDEDDIKPKTLAKALEKVAGKPEERLISTVALRSMKQAVYQPENIGHFGLAATYYTHFTSPIRRYPDLMVHRLLREQLSGKRLSREEAEERTAKLALISTHCSTRERAAIEAERQTVDLKMAEYMLQFVDQEFEGTISGVSSFGFFVELANGVEGLVHISSLTDDYYEYLEGQYALIGEHLGHRYRLGDTVKIQVLQVNVAERKIDFVLAGMPEYQLSRMRQDLTRQSKKKEKRQTGGALDKKDLIAGEAPAGDKKHKRKRRRKKKGGNAAQGQNTSNSPTSTKAPLEQGKSTNGGRRRRRNRHGKNGEGHSRKQKSKA
ncbi:ribonuclease R [Acidaminococcus sp. NSJ-142]|jgi:ribonuclease R|uniref:ribonuclease R n=1 Tax=Acidaminococcus TaxID=904 RepID=UPI000CF8943F|nr:MULTISPECIES: ribonuclease R [Acidaminococcus]MCD2435478.1 ribonuclease R [Acidaminococcus hominis]MCH4095249.1 ribonuclease R [Acidaminococcus provencensis]RHK03448.1 ribonuclease R [Acidaminococcus sp. AM05-11]